MTESPKIPRPPAGSGRRGGAFWRRVLTPPDGWTLDVAETEVLTSVCVLMGRAEALTAAVQRDGDVIEGPSGPRVHPAVVELRQCSTALGRLLAQLQLPDDDGEVMVSPLTARNRKGAAVQRAQRAEAAGSVSEMATRAIRTRWHGKAGA